MRHLFSHLILRNQNTFTTTGQKSKISCTGFPRTCT